MIQTTTPYNLQWLNYGKFFFKSQVFFQRTNYLIKNVTEIVIKKGSLTHNSCYHATGPKRRASYESTIKKGIH